MRYASSLLYGGMLVDAIGASYQDYSRLLLRCPFCGEAVFLSAASHRSSHTRIAPKSNKVVTVKECDVAASFAHFPGVAASDCELKSAKIKQYDISRSIARSRNQRLKFFQNYFWSIVSGRTEDMELYTVESVIKKANPFLSTSMVKNLASNLTNDCVKRFRDYNRAKEDVKLLLQTAIAQPDKIVIADDSDKHREAVNWLLSVEIDLHAQVVYEAIDFLKTKSVSAILLKIIDLSISYKINTKGELEVLRLASLEKSKSKLESDYEDLTTSICANIIAIVTGTKWADAMHDKSLKLPNIH